MSAVATAVQKANVNDAIQGGWVSWHQVSYDPASLAAASQRGDDITVANAKVGDMVIAQVEGPLNMIAVVGAKVTAAGIVTIYLQNFYDATTAVDQTTVNINILLLHKS